MPLASLPQDKIDALKAQFGDIFEVTAAEEVVYLRRPKRAEYQRFRDQILDENKRGRAMENLVKAVLVSPDPKTFEELLEVKPGLVENLGEQVTRLAGSAGDAEAKKL